MNDAVVNLLTLAFSAAGGAVGSYVAIRVRLAEIEAKQERDREHLADRIAEVRSAVHRAHERIDALLHSQGSGKWPDQT